MQLATDVLPVEGLAVDRVNAAAHCLSKAEAVMQPRGQKIEMTAVKFEDDPPDLAMMARKVALAFRLMAEANEPNG